VAGIFSRLTEYNFWATIYYQHPFLSPRISGRRYVPQAPAAGSPNLSIERHHPLGVSAKWGATIARPSLWWR
jgi:hypothetical protein